MNNFSFPVELLGNFTEISPTISLTRARIFYKGLNRNRTYISDEFAEKLLASVPYTPVKGIYIKENEDFADHGDSPAQGQVYGFIPKETNLRWETVKDEDGVERTYATVDAIIWTALYNESPDIVGKHLSMEIYRPSIKGQWTTFQGQQAFAFTDGIFQGLQVLGDKHNPCFEGAGFFSLRDTFMELYSYVEKLVNEITGGHTDMPMNFNLSDREKYDLLWKALNPQYNEADGYVVRMGINDVFEDYALCYNYEEHSFYRVYFTKSETAVEITSEEKRFVLDVSESEFNALNALRQMTAADDYTVVSEKYTELTTQIEANNQLISELNTKLEAFTVNPPPVAEPAGAPATDTFEEERKTLTSQIEELTATNASLNAELTGLKEFKLTQELTEKRGMVTKYSTLLSEEVLATYTDEKLGTFTVAELKRDLAAAYVDSTPTLFSQSAPQNPARLPKDEYADGSVEAVIASYKKKTPVMGH